MPKDTNQRAKATLDAVIAKTENAEEDALPVLHLRWTMAGYSTRATPVTRLPLGDSAR